MTSRRTILAACCAILACRAQVLVSATPQVDLTASADSNSLPAPGIICLDTTDGAPVDFKVAKVEDALGKPNPLVISPSSGKAPLCIGVAPNPNVLSDLPSGVYAMDVSFAPGPAPVGYVSTLVTVRLSGSGLPSINSVVNAATLGPAIAPGALVSIFGTHLSGPARSVPYDANGLYPTTFGNTTVMFNGVPAPLVYTSPTQINAVVPYSVAGDSVQIVAQHNGTTLRSSTAQLFDTAPGIFTADASGSGPGAILNATNPYFPTPNGPTNPVRKGDAVIIYATGTGVWDGPLQDGMVFLLRSKGPGVPYLSPLPVAHISLTIGGQPATVLYAGAAPYMVSSVVQINAIVPTNIGSGPQPIVLTVGQNSNAQQSVTVYVQ